jgi:hypothetical protein
MEHHRPETLHVNCTEKNKVMVLFFEEWVELINSGFCLVVVLGTRSGLEESF